MTLGKLIVFQKKARLKALGTICNVLWLERDVFNAFESNVIGFKCVRIIINVIEGGTRHTLIRRRFMLLNRVNLGRPPREL